MLGQLVFLVSYPAEAETVDDYLSTMSKEKLERTINRQFQYINKRLLSKKVVGKIENSKNDEAINLLNKARRMRNDIEVQIEAGEYKNAYKSLQKLNNFLSEAMKISRARERATKKILDELEQARIVNDAYFERIRKRFINKIDVNDRIRSLYKNAQTNKAEADKAKLTNEYRKATIRFQESTELLKKMIVMIRKLENPDRAESSPEIKMFGEE